MQLHFPQAGPTAVASATISSNQQFFGIAISLTPHFLPPAPNAERSEFSRVGADAYIHKSFISPYIVDPVRRCFSPFAFEVMGIDKTRAFPRSPFRTGIFVVPNKLLLLGVHRNHGEPLSQERLGSFIDVVELFVTIGRWLAFFDEFSVLLNVKSFFFKEMSDRTRRRDNAFYPRSRGLRRIIFGSCSETWKTRLLFYLIGYIILYIPMEQS